MAAKSEKAARRRPVGRPRSDGKAHLTKERVFEVSARLIAQHGYAGAGVRMIAAELGASTASFFHLFPSKDDLLNALIAYAAEPSFAFYAQLGAQRLPGDAALYKCVLEETRAVSEADLDHAALFYLPELRKPAFAAAQRVRARMIGQYRCLIDQGVAEGTLRAAQPALAAEQALQLTETSIVAERGALPAPGEQAEAAARFCLGALLVEPGRLDAVARAAQAVDLRFEPPEFQRQPS